MEFNLFWKLENDQWPNVIVLKNNYWFVSDRVVGTFLLKDECFVEFDVDIEYNKEHLYPFFKKHFCLNDLPEVRSPLVVNSKSIVMFQNFWS